MVAPSPNNPNGGAAESAVCVEAWDDFAQRQLAALELEWRRDGANLAILQPADEAAVDEPATARSWAGGLRTRKRPEPAEAAPAVLLESDSPEETFAWIADRLTESSRVCRLVPAGEPHAVHEIAAQMFGAYTIDGGAIHLLGCHLDTAPLLRLTAIDRRGADPTVRHHFFDAKGEPLTAEQVRELHLSEVTPPADGYGHADLAGWSDSIAAAGAAMPVPRDGDRMIVTLVAPTRVAGTLEVTIGEESLPIAFAGWARSITAPPAVCPQTGASTFHLTTTSDGKIAAAEQVVVCEETGSRVLARETVVCSVTGKTVSEECCETCPVSRRPALPSEFVACRRCGQRVSKTMITTRGCQGCDALARVNANDPRLAKVLAAAPKLDSRRKWSLAETATVLIAETGSLLTRTLLVVDKPSGNLAHAATRTRPSPQWRKMTDEQVRERLG